MSSINKGRLFVRQRPSDKELSGIIRRGIFEIDRTHPRRVLKKRNMRSGSNPYETASTDRIRAAGRRHRDTGQFTPRNGLGTGNPYETAGRFRTGKSWDDVEFDTLEINEK